MIARYIPKQLTDFQRAERVRICKENLVKFNCRKSSNAALVTRGDSSPTIVRRSRFASRALLCIFFKSAGPLSIHYVERGQTIDHQYYIDNCSQPVINEIKNPRLSFGTRAIKLYHENGTSHFHQEVLHYLELEDITIIPYPTNSPDLAGTM